MTLAFVIAEHLFAQERLEQFIERSSDIRVVAADGIERLSRKARTGLVLVVDNCGLKVPLKECLRRLRRLCPKARALLLDEETVVDQALWAGMQGVLTHAAAESCLVTAIQRIHEGGNWFPASALAHGQSVYPAGRGHRGEEGCLTSREEEALMWLRQHLANGEIARKMGISRNTVKSYVRSVLAKQHAVDRRELLNRPRAISRLRLFATPFSLMAKMGKMGT